MINYYDELRKAMADAPIADCVEVDYRREFECGHDFCPDCGDCLYCYGGDKCYRSDNEIHGFPEPRED